MKLTEEQIYVEFLANLYFQKIFNWNQCVISANDYLFYINEGLIYKEMVEEEK